MKEIGHCSGSSTVAKELVWLIQFAFICQYILKSPSLLCVVYIPGI